MGASRRFVLPLVAMAAAGVALFAMRGFTVDDALIGARYAAHIASGHGPRFNISGPVTDGVTPLIWPWLLAPFSKSGALAGLAAAKWIGAVSWIVVVGLLARRIDEIADRKWAWAHLALLVVIGTPAVSAWAVAGMETGVAMSLATAAVVVACPVTSSSLAGAVALLRPEMVVWASVIALGNAWTKRKFTPHTALAVVPFAVVCAVREVLFGAVAPLALRAKPSDLQHGAVYVLAAILVTGPILAVVAPRAWARLDVRPRWILGAFAAHGLVVLAVGGDWMPMSRLLVPALPSLAIVFAHLAKVSSVPSVLVRLALCVAGQAFVVWRVGYDAAHVTDSRMRLIEQLRPQLQNTDVVAALDVGWVGASFDGTVIDLAGLTDPAIASLPGGHTSKAIAPMQLAEKGATAIVLWTAAGTTPQEAWEQGKFTHDVERRLARMDYVREHFQPAGVVEGNPKLRYLVLKKQ
jgi:hypothetical protein